MTSGFKFAAVVFLAVLTIFVFPYPSHAQGAMGATDEEEIGRKADKQIIKAYGLYDDEKLQEYVRHIGKKSSRKLISRNTSFTSRL